jgi:hypothetical protein
VANKGLFVVSLTLFRVNKGLFVVFLTLFGANKALFVASLTFLAAKKAFFVALVNIHPPSKQKDRPREHAFRASCSVRAKAPALPAKWSFLI